MALTLFKCFIFKGQNFKPMQKLLLLSVFIGCLFLLSFRDDKKKKIVFFGDSITEAGAKPGGYIKIMEQMLVNAGKAQKYELVGAGIGGNKVYDLYLRMENDVLAKNPDIVVIYIGVNDVWHKASSGTGTDYWKFGPFYEALVKKIQASGAKVVVCTPGVIGERTDNSNQLDGDLNLYSKWIRDFSAKNNLPLVDVRKVFMDYNTLNNPTNQESKILTTDRVHLNEKGNAVLAEAMWNVLGSL
jgi:lysophospholipase L1-like esterase